MGLEVKVLKNIFSQANLKKIKEIIDLVNWKQNRNQIIEQIQSVSPPQYLWLIGDNPAYHLQYQKQSVAILKIQNMIVIVWKPKYIQYPSLIKFPQHNLKKLSNMQIIVNQSRTKMGQTLMNNLLEYIQLFYGSFFHSDEDFETNLITYVKHYVSKVSRLSYWHCAIDDTGKLQVSRFQEAQSRIVLNITGVKQNYDKQLVIFSLKGTKGNILDVMKNKWLQVISFFAMLLIFVAAVGCESQDTTGMCLYKNQLMIGGAAVMMGLMGMRIASRKKGKKNKAHDKKD